MSTRTQVALDIEFERLPDKAKTWRDGIQSPQDKLRSVRWRQLIGARFPILGVLYHYNLRDNLLRDMLSGVSVGMSSVPQAMGYASILHVPMQYGLYTLIFSSLIYSVFTTSIHSSVVISASGVIFTYDALESLGLNDNLPSTNTTNGLSPEMEERLEAIFALSFISGITLIVTTICKFSVVGKFSSEPHMLAIFAATTTVIWINQIPPMLGIVPESHTGFLPTVKLIIDICSRISDTNIWTLIISVTCLVIVLFVKEFVNVRLAHVLPAPLPIDIVVMISATLMSSLWDWEGNLGVDIIGYIPSGLPAPQVPLKAGWTEYIRAGVFIGVLHHLGAPIMVKHFAVKYDYEDKVSMDQETFAVGATAAISTITACPSVGPASPRLLMMESCGGKTQMSYVFAALTSLCVVLFLTDFGTTLPSCVVAVIIFCSALGGAASFKRVYKYWRRDKMFFLMWVFTYGVFVLFNTSDAIFYGLIFNILLTALKAKQLQLTELYEATTKGMRYLIPGEKYSNCSPPATHAKVIAVNNPIFFANAYTLKKYVLKLVVASEKAEEDKVEATHNKKTDISYINIGFTSDEQHYSSIYESKPRDKLSLVVLDFTGVSFVDTSTLRELVSLNNILHDKYSITLRISGCNERCRAAIARAPAVYNLLRDALYYTAGDAVADCVDVTAVRVEHETDRGGVCDNEEDAEDNESPVM